MKFSILKLTPYPSAFSLLFMAILCSGGIGWLARAEDQLTDEDKRIRMLTEYLVLLEPRRVPVEYGRQLIPDLIRLLNAKEKLPDLEKQMDLRDRRSRLIQGLIKAIKSFEGFEEAGMGRKVVYDLASNAETALKREAMFGLLRLDGEGATDTWLQKLRDSDETIRVDAARLLGGHGRLDSAVQIKQILQERAQGLSSEQIARDHSFRFGEAAIAEIQDRAGGKKGASASERVNAAGSIERGLGGSKGERGQL